MHHIRDRPDRLVDVANANTAGTCGRGVLEVAHVVSIIGEQRRATTLKRPVRRA